MSNTFLSRLIAKAFRQEFTDSNPLPVTGGTGGNGGTSAATIASGVNQSNLNTLAIAPINHSETLNSPSVGTARDFNGFNTVICSYTIATINNSVTVRLEGRLTTSSDWVNLDPSEVDTTKNANGTYGLLIRDLSLDAVRFNFVSEVGGTNATIATVLRFARL